MRRKDREVREFSEILSIMERCQVCHVAMNQDVYPYVLPLNFGMEVKGTQIFLYFHGAQEGKKYTLLARNPYVGFAMDCSHQLIPAPAGGNGCSCGMAYESVIGNGVMELVPSSEKEHALRLLMQHYGQTNLQFGEETLDHTLVLRLRVVEYSGKRRLIEGNRL